MKRHSWWDVVVIILIVQSSALTMLTTKTWLPKLGLSYLLAYENVPDATFHIVDPLVLSASKVASVRVIERLPGEIDWQFYDFDGNVFTLRSIPTQISSAKQIYGLLDRGRAMPVVQWFIDTMGVKTVKEIRLYRSFTHNYIFLLSGDGEIIGMVVYYKD
ncbi:MAG: hypothetical protein SNJ72_01400 [Fimbriimonadales bacterium]